MKTLTTPFTTAKDKTAHAPVTLLEIIWQPLDGLPALTLRLTDRGASGSPTSYSAFGETWYALVEGWGRVSFQVNLLNPEANASGALRVSLLNNPFTFPELGTTTLTEIFIDRPPEAATAKVYQWFDDESLVLADVIPEFTADLEEVQSFNESLVVINLVDQSLKYGQRLLGNVVTTNAYPNAPQENIGAVLPLVIGDVANVPGVRVRDTAETTVDGVAIPGDTVVNVKDTSHFPSTGTIVVNEDEISYTGKTATSFTGCQTVGDDTAGIANFHYTGEKVVEKATDHDFIVMDPAYGPAKAISNVKVAGVLADPADYTTSLADGRVRFNKRPSSITAQDSEFLEMQFDEVDASNTAANAANSFDPDEVTEHATIDQVTPKLAVKQTDAMANRGAIKRVYLSVEHFEDELVPNDTLEVAIASIGVLGNLKKPNVADAVEVAGTVDITHNHLENIGGNTPIDHGHTENIGGTTDPNHEHTDNTDTATHVHTINSDAENTVIQTATGGVSDSYTGNFTSHTITFPSAPAGTVLRTLYSIKIGRGQDNLGAPTYSGADGSVTIGTGGPKVFETRASGQTREYWEVDVEVSGSAGTTIDLKNAGFTTITMVVYEATRKLIYDAAVTGVNQTTGINIDALNTSAVSLSRSGAITDHTENKGLTRSGSITSYTGGPETVTETVDSVKRSVIERFDITSSVTGWDWFENQVASVEYKGTTDARQSFIIHIFFDVEYAVQTITFSDAVTADVQGVQDDASGSVTGTANALIERPDHVFKWSILKALELTTADFDATSFTAAGTAFAAAVTGGYKLAGVLLARTEYRKLWTDWGVQSRSVLYWEADGKARLEFRRKNDVSVFSSTKALTASMVLAEPTTGRSLISGSRSPKTNLVNLIDLNYDLDPAAREYRALYAISDTPSRQKYGVREKESRYKFDWVRHQATAEDVADFELAENSKPHSLLKVEVPLNNIELERFDDVAITHPFNGMESRPALIVGRERVIGSGKQRRMDTVTLYLRLYPVETVRHRYRSHVSIAAVLHVNHIPGSHEYQSFVSVDTSAVAA